MVEPSGSRDPEGGTDRPSSRGSVRSRTRWKFVLGIIIAVALVVLMVVLHLSGALGPGVH